MILVGRKATGGRRTVVGKLAGQTAFLGRRAGGLARSSKQHRGVRFDPGARPAAGDWKISSLVPFDVTLF